MGKPSKKKRDEMTVRRQQVLDYLKASGTATVNQLAKHMGLDSLTVNHTVRILIYGGAVEKTVTTYIPNIHGKKTRVYVYKLTGSAFDPDLARKNKSIAHTPKQLEPAEPHVRRVLLQDKKPYKNQGGQGNVGRGPHIGRGSWGVV